MKGAIEISQKEMIQNGDAPVTKEGYIPLVVARRAEKNRKFEGLFVRAEPNLRD
jgi:hypothetical protein